MARRPSSIDRQPKEVREAIGRLREDGCTIDEILAHLGELKAGVSRSALGRHVKTLEQVGKRMRRSREMAEALTAKFGDQPDHQVSRLNFQLMHGIVFEMLTAAPGSDDGEDGDEGQSVTLDPQQVKFMAGALKDLEAAQKSATDRTIKLRAEIARENAQKIDGAERSGEIDAEAAEKARRILGFA